MKKLKASCIAVMINCGHYNQGILIHHSGGDFEDWNIWEQELDNSIYIEDIFYNYEQPPDKIGFYIWEGELEPVHNDQPIYNGKWRKATKQDMTILVDD